MVMNHESRSGTRMCWLSSHLLHTWMWTSLASADGSWPDQGNRAMSSAKCKDLILDSLNRNSVCEGYEQNVCQREALVESKPHHKWIGLIAGNADRDLTPGVLGDWAWIQQSVTPYFHCNPHRYLSTWSNAFSKSTENMQTGWRNSHVSSRTMLRPGRTKTKISPLKSEVYLSSWPSSVQPLNSRYQGGCNILSSPLSQIHGHTGLFWLLIFLFHLPYIVIFQSCVRLHSFVSLTNIREHPWVSTVSEWTRTFEYLMGVNETSWD